ncbi:uncharacterized protein LOC119088384 [Peromyscus leucopus]|uniref:uncharacterized protein LOC119088384 n=1 Tax=Peromyscus leucopus TaxID=10041 RepID=UPI001884BE66|nr:uncharacterized protein LOC119088384 [Peromyscus leucopus]
MQKASHFFDGTPGTPAVGERQTASPDVVLTESVEILPLGITLQVIKQLAEEDGGAHAAVCRHCELPSECEAVVGVLRRFPGYHFNEEGQGIVTALAGDSHLSQELQEVADEDLQLPGRVWQQYTSVINVCDIMAFLDAFLEGVNHNLQQVAGRQRHGLVFHTQDGDHSPRSQDTQGCHCLRANADQGAQGCQHEVGLSGVQQLLQELNPIAPEDLLSSCILSGQDHKRLGNVQLERKLQRLRATPGPGRTNPTPDPRPPHQLEVASSPVSVQNGLVLGRRAETQGLGVCGQGTLVIAAFEQLVALLPQLLGRAGSHGEAELRGRRRSSLWSKGGPGIGKMPGAAPPQRCVGVTPKKARPRQGCSGARAGSSAALRRRRRKRRLRDAASVSPLGPVGGARRRPEGQGGGGGWRLGVPSSVPDRGRSARNLRSSVPPEEDRRSPVRGAGLAPCGRGTRIKSGHWLRQVWGYGAQSVGESAP